MILDELTNADRYLTVHPGFAAAFDFLRSGGWREMPAGKHPLDGERLWVNIVEAPGKGQATARLEIHRDFIDIQFAAVGTDIIGWSPTARCTTEDGAFNTAKDLGFFTDRPATWLTVAPGDFAIFYPEDAHAPMAADGPLRKVVVKVAVTW